MSTLIKLTPSFPMLPHVIGNSTPLKFHCGLTCPVTQSLISLAVTRKLNSPEFCKAPNCNMHKFNFHLRTNLTDSVEYSIFPEFFNFTFSVKNGLNEKNVKYPNLRCGLVVFWSQCITKFNKFCQKLLHKLFIFHSKMY